MARRTRGLKFGKRITACRLQCGLSQTALARRAGIAPSYISRLENNKIQPTVGTAMRIASSLRISLGDLLGPSPPILKDKPCPVSRSGDCLLDLLEDDSPSSRRADAQRFSPRQIRLLKRFAGLLCSGTSETLGALEILVNQLLRSSTPARR